MKSDFHERKQRKENRFAQLADKNRKESEALSKKSSDMASIIPFGQPILIGHHSEKRDRNYREKIFNTMGQSVKASQKAEYYESRLEASQSNNAISSDDPEALIKLKSKLADLVSLQNQMKDYNKILKHKKLSTSEKISKLLSSNLKLTEAQATELTTPDRWGRVGFPSYRLTNNNANIRRIEQRIKQLEKIAAISTSEIEIGSTKIVINAEANRVQILFPNKPDESTRTELKRNGFRWSPMEKAWQRQISNHAQYIAKKIVEKYETKPSAYEGQTETTDNGPTGHGDECLSDADPGL